MSFRRLNALIKRAKGQRSMVITATENRPVLLPMTLEEKQLADRVDDLLQQTLHAQMELAQYRVILYRKLSIYTAMRLWFE